MVNNDINACAVGGAEGIARKCDEHITIIYLTEMSFTVSKQVIIPVQCAVNDGEGAADRAGGVDFERDIVNTGISGNDLTT
ncbi:hypothetical protein RRF57_002529 [Xylaria bambusicola]|uniref:Uncharacterized protein n=1 Tax=Xylaria bambusicola TaxID=326684 RepID=A0AAN7UD97_9PEZI